MEKEPGVYNFDPANPPISPITGKPVETYYKLNQTWTSVFSSVSSTYEECRAEAVAMTLVCHPEVLAVFGHTTPEEQDDVRYVAWLQMARAGLMALEFYNPASKKHGQAHMQARFAILQVFLRAGQGFVEIEEREEADGKNLIVHLDRSKILTVGKPAVDAFLQKLHVYKMTADVTNGTAFYLDHTVVDEKFVAWRDIVISRKQPRKLFVQGNTVLNADGTVGWVDYEPSLEGLVRSWVERRV